MQKCAIAVLFVFSASALGQDGADLWAKYEVRIPMMSISHSDLMPIRTERSDAGLSQCEIVIDIRQEFCLFSLSGFIGNLPFLAVRVFGR
jgi:hypothetical protein